MEELIKKYKKYITDELTLTYVNYLLKNVENMMRASVNPTFGLDCERNGTVLLFGSSHGLFALDGTQIKVIGKVNNDVLSVTVTSDGDIVYGTNKGILSRRSGKMIRKGEYITALFEIGNELYNVQLIPDFVRVPGEIRRTHTNETVFVFEYPILSVGIVPPSKELEERISRGKVKPDLYEIKGKIEEDIVIVLGTPWGVYALYNGEVGKIANTEGAHSIFVTSDGRILHGTRNGYVYETLGGKVINTNRKNEETVSGIVEIGNKLYHSTGSWASGGLGQILETKNDQGVVFFGPPIYCMTIAPRHIVADVLEQAPDLKTLITKILDDVEAELESLR